MGLPLVSNSSFCRAALLPWLLACLLLAPGTPAATKKPPSQPINLNAASSEQLQQVPGIGPATADKILQMRKSYGPFKSVDDLLAIRGIGKKHLDKMRKYLIAGIRRHRRNPAPRASLRGHLQRPRLPVAWVARRPRRRMKRRTL
jgi:competence ComEA-like helix-hairpin-helix protein